MLSHYLKTIIRNAARSKWFTLIIVSALSLGLACALTILLAVRYELSFDKFHIHKERIYQVQQVVSLESGDYKSDRTGGAYAQALIDRFPEIEKVTRLGPVHEVVVSLTAGSKQDKITSFIEDKIWAADSTFLRIFTFPPLLGNTHTALTNKYALVLTESAAEKYFGETWQTNNSVIGTTLRLDDRINLSVAAVINDPPFNSNIQFDMLVSFEILDELGYYTEGFGGTTYHTFLLLKPNTNPDNINNEITPYIRSLHEPEIASRQFLIPLERVHLYDEQLNYIFIYLFGAIAFFILIIACINFINLSTARSINRAKEVAIRKIEGASRLQLLIQFLGEAFVLTLISTQLAIILVELFFLPEFNRLGQSQINITYSDPQFILSVAGLIVFTTIAAGTYPAFVLSAMIPSKILRSNREPGKRGSLLRKLLVVTQFTITLFFIICTVVIIRQFNFLDNADLGFDKDNIIFMPLRGNQMENYASIKTELLRSPDIQSVTTGSSAPNYVEHGEINWGRLDEDNNAIARILFVGYDFIEAFGIEILEGRAYAREIPSDTSHGIVVNRAVVEMLGMESPVGEKFYFWDDPYTIIGVVDYFNFFPFDIGGRALIMPFGPVQDYMFIKMNPGSEASVTPYAQQVMASFNPVFPFEYYHLDDARPPFMDNRDNLNLLMVYFSIFGIFISCLGLYGLTIHTTEQKTKEIGIRKVFGASVTRIAMLLSGNFLKLILLANLVAIPLAYLAMNMFIKFFTSRIDLNLWIFAIPAIATLLLALFTVSGKAVQAANKNPTDSLRYE